MIGVFGGSGFYEFLDDATATPVPTPYGAPAADPMVGTVDGIEVVFIPRHGREHQFPPHKVPFRANVHAMRTLGVDRIIGPTAVGSLQPNFEPGHFAVPDQIVDRTSGREYTFYDGPEVEHLSFADPYHPAMRTIAIDGMRATGSTVHDGGTVVVIQGPRFSTRAESKWFSSLGWELINMTQIPEASLSAEAGIPYVNISVITDYDVGVVGGTPVTHEEVIRMFGESAATLQEGIRNMLAPLAAASL